MPIDFGETRKAVNLINDKSQEMAEVLKIGQRGKVSIDIIGDKVFTVAEKNLLRTRYAELKTELTDLIAGLP